MRFAYENQIYTASQNQTQRGFQERTENVSLIYLYSIGIKGGKIQWQSGEKSECYQISARYWYEFHFHQEQDIYSRTYDLNQEASQDS